MYQVKKKKGSNHYNLVLNGGILSEMHAFVPQMNVYTKIQLFPLIVHPMVTVSLPMELDPLVMQICSLFVGKPQLLFLLLLWLYYCKKKKEKKI